MTYLLFDSMPGLQVVRIQQWKEGRAGQKAAEIDMAITWLFDCVRSHPLLELTYSSYVPVLLRIFCRHITHALLVGLRSFGSMLRDGFARWSCLRECLQSESPIGFRFPFFPFSLSLRVSLFFFIFHFFLSPILPIYPLPPLSLRRK